MMNFSLVDRAGFYQNTFPKWPDPRADERWIDGMWVLGNDYRGSGYYGAYPPNYLRRVMSMFPDAACVLHLFSGSLPQGPYIRFDSNPDSGAEIVGDAHRLSEYVVSGMFDLILADPPYSSEDAEHYGTAMIKRNKVMSECAKIMPTGGYLVWLDQVLPMFRKSELNLCGLFGVVRSTNHRFRVSCWFKRL
jgi:hypothetical protein